MLKQSLQQKLSQKLSPQQIKLMKLIQLPTIELEQKVKEEIEANPAIEEGVEQAETSEFEDHDEREDQRIEADEINVDEYLSDDETPNYKLSANNYSPDDEEKQIPDKSVPVAMGISSTEILEKQLSLRNLDDHFYQIGLYLIGCVDDNGYIRRELSAIVDDLAFNQNLSATEEEISEVLTVVQDFEPPGIGARNLQECMQIQLTKKNTSEVVVLAREIVSNHFNALSKKHYDKLLSRLSITEEMLRKALKEIAKLNPKPGSALFGSSRIVQHIIPDFRIAIIKSCII